MREKLIHQIEEYVPFNEQEEKDRVLILEFLKNNDNAFLRTNMTAHMTASSWIVNANRTKILAVYHKIYDSWAWTGGHADGDEDLLKVAVKEAKEETGISKVIPVSEDIYSLEILTVDGHEKHDCYVPCHLHMNITYLLQADEEEMLHICEEENNGVSWFSYEEFAKKCTEPWFLKRIYSKLDAKLAQI